MTTVARTCTKCCLLKPLEEFSRAPRGKYGRKANCRSCDAARQRAKYVPNPDGRRAKRRGPIDPDSLNTCRGCGETKPYRLFSLSSSATATRNAVYRNQCKKCRAVCALQWFRDNPGRTMANSRKHNLKMYGISERDYTDLLKSQGGGCAICGTASSDKRKNGKPMRLPVDHDHATGVCRGILCNRCNRAIGLLRDDPILFRKAIRYLMNARKPQVVLPEVG
jgi:hypothetical protein